MDTVENTLQGYLSPLFGDSYRSFGEILRLPRSGLQLLKRPITGPLYDLIGVYPYVMCSDWSGLNHDIAELRGSDAVSAVFVTDPFEGAVVRELTKDWPLSRHFKSHYVVDLTRNWSDERRKEERRFTRRALEKHVTQVVTDPVPLAPQLWEFYQTTIERKQVRGMQRTSLATIQQQLAIPGRVLVAASDEDGLAGAILSYVHGETASCHLSFLSERAVRNRTSYALIHASLVELETRGCRFANLGGPAGNDDDPADGLARFKFRWTQMTESARLCGAVLNAAAYRKLEHEAQSQPTSFFPSYRAPTALPGS